MRDGEAMCRCSKRFSCGEKTWKEKDGIPEELGGVELRCDAIMLRDFCVWTLGVWMDRKAVSWGDSETLVFRPNGRTVFFPSIVSLFRLQTPCYCLFCFFFLLAQTTLPSSYLP